jgi:uncharacterized protein YpmS
MKLLKMKFNNQQIAFFIIIGVLLVYILFFTRPKGSLPNDQAEFDKMKTEISAARDSLTRYDDTLHSLKSTISVLVEQLDDNQPKYKTIYRAYERKTKSVDSYTVDSVEQFLADRYRQDSTEQ